MNVTDINQAKLSIGDLVHHKLFDYRGVVVDVDPQFQSNDEWYELVAKSRPPKNKPWYHVLVDANEHTTYVAEQNLEPDNCDAPIKHYLLEHFFESYKHGHYILKHKSN